MFRGEAYRSPSEIAKLVEVSVLPGSRAENGATRQALRWSIPGGVTGPSLGGEATIWSYPPGSRHEGLLLLFATAKN